MIQGGVIRVDFAKLVRDHPAQGLSVAQAQPHVLVHFRFIMLMVMVLVIMIVILIFVVMLVFHAFHKFLGLGQIAQGFHQVHGAKLGVRGGGKHILGPFIAFPAHENEQVSGGNFQDIRGGGLEIVQVRAGIQQHGQFDVFQVFTGDFPYPVIDGENGGHHMDLFLRQGGAGKQGNSQQGQGQKSGKHFFHVFHGIHPPNSSIIWENQGKKMQGDTAPHEETLLSEGAEPLAN